MLIACWIAYVGLLLVTAAAGVIDLRTGKVPNRLTVPSIVTALCFWPIVGLVVGGWSAAGALFGDATFAMLCGLVPFALLVLTAGLGGGDMKLMAAVGAISASWEVVLSTTVYGLIVAVLMALVVMVRQRIVGRTLSRLVSAALLASARVKPAIPRDSPTVAFAAAVFVGAAVAGAEQLLGLQTPWRALSP